MVEWNYPETWQVGDKLDQVTLNRRISDQNALLLRRPLLVAHNSGSTTLSNAGDAALSFDTIDQDDDGMCLTGTPATCFWAQRNGTYQIWLNISGNGNGTACPTWRTGLLLNGVAPGSQANRRWDVITGFPTTNGRAFYHSLTGTVFLSAGEYISVALYQNSGASMTLPATNNTPRLVIMWWGIT